MQLTPELEAELRLALDTYWNSYLEGDIETWASYLADEYHNIGTTEEEVWQSKQEIVDYTRSVIQQLQGGAQVRNKTFQFYPIDPYIMVHELGDMYLIHDGDWVFYSRIRMTSLMEKRKEGWKILHQHGSYPDANASHGDVLGFEKIKNENNELREAVQRRTIDLEVKNRELEIEAALERVRAVAMGMKTPNEMLDVCKVISEELEKFGVRHIRNIQTVIISREISDYTCYQYFTAYRLTAIEQTHFERNKVEQALVDRMLDAKGGYFEGILSGEDMDVFRLYRKREKFFEDPLLDQCEEAFYYFYSIGEGGLGITLYEDMDAEGLSLFKRFHQVFSLAYQRFRDIENAEAQAREAQIEAAMEKVRGRSLAMQGPDEIREVAELLRSEMAQLGVEALETSSIYIREPEKDTIGCWYAIKDVRGEDSRLVSDEMTLNLSDTWVGQEMQRFLASEEEQISIPMQGDQRKEWINYCAQRSEALKGYYGTEIPERTYHLVKFTYGFIGAVSPGEISAESWRLLKRSAAVFSFAYTRFLDLSESAQNAREAQIELGLERVRAKTMAMYKSTQLSETARVLFEQFSELGRIPDRMSIGIVKDELGLIEWWATDQTGSQLTNHFDATIEQPTVAKIFAGWKEGKESMVIEITGEELKAWVAFVKDNVQMPMDDTKIKGKRVHHAAYFSQGILLISAHERVQDETMRILVRFAKVFEQAYTRFLDLKKAEAQAHEAQVEAALERVRSKTMAMHNSADVGETAAVMVEELRKLGIDTLRCGIGIMHEPGEMEVWTIQTEKEGKSGIIIGTLDMHMHPLLNVAFENWRNKGPQFSYVLEGDDMLGYYGAINNHPGYPIRYDLSALPSRVYHNEFLFPEGVLFSFSLEPLQETQKAIFQRFAGIFGQTYRRYLDLTRAEAQAREAQIEAALEKIRSRSLAMHSSQELIDVIAVVFEKMNELKILMGTVAIWLFDMESVSSTFWLGNEVQKEPSKVSLPYDEGMMNREGCLKDAWEARRKGENIINKRYDKKLKDEYFDYVFAHNDYQTIPDAARHFIRGASSQTINLIIEKNSTLFVDNWTDQTYSEAQLDVFKRVARVFEQAYVRFLDLQKAEAQARESNIEAALERVRSKAMAMRTSEDIAETTAASFEELRKLGVFSFRSGVGILSKDSRTVQVFADSRAEDDKTVALTTVRSMDEHPALQRQYDSWLEQKDFEQVLRGDELSSYYRLSFFKGSSVEQRGVGEQQEEYGYYFAFPDGLFYSWSLQPYSEQEKNILHRFRNIISLTFRRYLDLQKAEIQALEATKQASLDRVRGVISSMRSAEDLNLITPLIFKELTILGVPFIRCGVFIIHERQQIIEAYLSAPDGHSLGVLNLPFNASDLTYKTVAAWRKNDMLLQHWNKEDFVAWTNQMVSEHQIEDSKTYQGADLPPDSLDLHFVPFAQGMLYVGTTEPLEESKLELVQSLARTFSIAYARYEDFVKLENAKEEIESALTELKATQKQLIQSEKMASLGELTAGIAHEIQNPLNFVNNFSEVSKELIEEVKESIAKGEMADAMDMMSDLVQNLEKINEHGKRADSIVKGMLQHSRAGSGQKEATDINVLADECLRLAFHGLRAKDKSFNANFETVFDAEIGKIDVMPQDMGRVLLNLINNAFYTVNEKSKRGEVGYKPMVKVSTEKREKGVGIRVWDNGDGIPDAIKEKIFQPFFTTKPTGQGTGLGLSLAYDIVKAHGGELTVESREGEGTMFFILLPSS